MVAPVVLPAMAELPRRASEDPAETAETAAPVAPAGSVLRRTYIRRVALADTVVPVVPADVVETPPPVGPETAAMAATAAYPGPVDSQPRSETVALAEMARAAVPVAMAARLAPVERTATVVMAASPPTEPRERVADCRESPRRRPETVERAEVAEPRVALPERLEAVSEAPVPRVSREPRAAAVPVVPAEQRP